MFTHRVRRLNDQAPLSRRAVGAHQLFATARVRKPIRPLEIGIHLAGIGSPDAITDLILGTLTSRGRKGRPIFRVSSGDLPASVDAQAVRTFEIDEGPPNDLVGEVAYAVERENEDEHHASVWGHAWWHWVAENELNDAGRFDDLVQLNALVALGCDLIITRDPALLRVRDARFLRSLNLMTPEEAFVLAGVWSRVSHEAFVAGNWGTSLGGYNLALAHALVPAARPALTTLVDPRGLKADDANLFELVASIVSRVASSARALDQLVTTWHCPTDTDTLDELLDDFDRIVLNAWGIYDNLALLVGQRLGVEALGPPKWSVLDLEWRKAVRVHGGAAAESIVQLIEREMSRLRASQAVRHHVAHRARVTPVRVFPGRRDPPRPGVWITGNEVVSRFQKAVAQAGDALVDWGVEATLGSRRETVALVGGGNDEEAYDLEIGASMLVDPLVFGLRVSAHAFWLANEVVSLLIPSSQEEPANPPGRQPRPAVPQSDDWFGSKAAAVAILSGPLSGLVDYALPLQAGRTRSGRESQAD